MKAKILVIDDHETTRETVSEVLHSQDWIPFTAANGSEFRKLFDAEDFDLVLTDLMLPDTDGLKILQEIKEKDANLPVVLITGQGSIDTAVQAMKMGARDYITKPLDPKRLRVVVDNALEERRLRLENLELRKRLDERSALDTIVGSSPPMHAVLDRIQRVAPTDATVLILGESGTGKELAANTIHALSSRAKGPLVKINSAAVPRELLESELFGHEKGSFTGALSRKIGRFEQADRGTLFLDEIGNMPVDTQVKLLRVLEEQKFERVGGTQTIHTDARLLAATNTDLKKEIEEGRFREDLYYRLNVVPIEMPPLRAHKEDLPLLLDHFVRYYNASYRVNRRFSREALDVLLAYAWPGNVRELRNLVEKSVIMTRGEEIGPQDLPPELAAMRPATARAPAFSVGESLDRIEERAIRQTLEVCAGQKTKAARMLGIGLKTLYRKLERYNIQ